MTQKEFMIVFQIGNVDYLVGNHFYTAHVQQLIQDETTLHFVVSLNDDLLIEHFGKTHDYYYYQNGHASFHTGANAKLMDLHYSILKALDVCNRNERRNG